MRIGVIGDTHLGKSLFGYDLTQSTRGVMYAFFKSCVENRCTYAVHLGDVGDRPVWSVAQQKMFIQWCNEFERVGIKLRVLVGNHDVISRFGTTSALDSARANLWDHVEIIDRPTLETYGDTNLLYLPFPSPARYSEEEWKHSVDTTLDGVDASPITFAHLNVYGAVLGEQEFVYRGEQHTIPERAISLSKLLVAGHIHTPQEVGKTYILGASNRTRFSERSDKRHFLIIDTGPTVGRTRVKQIKAPAIRMRQITVREKTTTEATNAVRKKTVEGRLVKVIPIVEDGSGVDWKAIESALYDNGALHVAMATPIRATKRKRIKLKSTDQPADLARRFVKARISDRDEAEKILGLFKVAEEAVDHAD